MAFALGDPATAKAVRLADAVAAIRAHLGSISDTEMVDLSQARGRVLAEDLITKVSLPHWDSAAVDGFALRAPDLLPGRPNRLTVVGEAAAGRPFPGIVGAMSVGGGDYIRSIIGRRGALEFWPLAIKPGKPVGVGDIDDCPMLALPGNPIAAVVAFIAVGRPMIDVVSGASQDPPRSLSIPAAFTLEKRSGVRQFLVAEVRACDHDENAVVPGDRQGTGMLSALTGSDGFIVLHEDREVVRRGERVDFLPMQAYLS